MSETKSYRICLIGAGNVGFHLAKAFHKSPHELIQVFSRSENSLKDIAPSFCSEVTTDLSAINLGADIYILAIKDDAIEEVVQKMPQVKGIVAHTSGATPSTVLQSQTNFGIFYPLQTFTRTKLLRFSDLPICVDGNQDWVKENLLDVASCLTPKVYELDDHQRQVLHVAAVFANNFTNHMLTLSEAICTDFDVPFEILKPLIQETLAKVNIHSPSTIQTGPAIRGDQKTLEKHEQLLSEKVDLKELYQQISKSIQESNK